MSSKTTQVWVMNSLNRTARAKVLVTPAQMSTTLMEFKSQCSTLRARVSCVTHACVLHNTPFLELKSDSTMRGHERKQTQTGSLRRWRRSRIKLAPISSKSPNTPMIAVSRKVRFHPMKSSLPLLVGAAFVESGAYQTASCAQSSKDTLIAL